MTVALHPDLPVNLLSHLIVADIAPSRGALSSEFQSYIEAMQKIESSQVTNRQDAQRILTEYEPVCILWRILTYQLDKLWTRTQ